MAAWRGRFRNSLGFGLFLGFCLTGAASAASVAPASSMLIGGATSQPIGHFEFCQSHRAECAIRPAATGPVHVTPALWKMLERVNLGVNGAIRPANDIDIYGKDEVWTYPDRGIGDCEDFVLEKRRILERKGISLANLLITVVRKLDGEGHAVLTVRTDRGDFILDNLSQQIKPWDRTGYRYLKRQASDNTGRWVSLREENNLLVGAVRH